MSTAVIASLPISTAVAECFRGLSAKFLAGKSGASPRTVEKWLRRETAPQAHHLLAMLSDDDLCALLLEKVNPDAAHGVKVAAARKKLRQLKELEGGK